MALSNIRQSMDTGTKLSAGSDHNTNGRATETPKTKAMENKSYDNPWSDPKEPNSNAGKTSDSAAQRMAAEGSSEGSHHRAAFRHDLAVAAGLRVVAPGLNHRGLRHLLGPLQHPHRRVDPLVVLVLHLRLLDDVLQLLLLRLRLQRGLRVVDALEDRAVPARLQEQALEGHEEPVRYAVGDREARLVVLLQHALQQVAHVRAKVVDLGPQLGGHDGLCEPICREPGEELRVAARPCLDLVVAVAEHRPLEDRL
mmetsp:Transcript_18300/g.51808  ORF Transcript_18300/g.51808 Transcript_18300/m.51808 type:complete len:254 (-) Transcript_18300:922-1683(-)